MRILTTLLALFSCGLVAAQPYSTTEGRELPRGVINPCISATDAATNSESHRYRSPIHTWSQAGNRFSADFTSTFAWTNRQVLLHIESASCDYELWINGQRAAINRDGNAPADYNITKLIKEGRNNAEVILNIPSDLAPIEGWKSDSTTPALGPCYLISSPTMGVRDFTVRTEINPETPEVATTEVGIIVKSYALNPRSVRIFYELDDPAGRQIAHGQTDLTLDMRGEDTVRFLASVPDTMLWSTTNPKHHTLRIRTQRDGRFSEYHQYALGLRAAELKEGKLYINGQSAALRTESCVPTASPEVLQKIKNRNTNTILLEPGAVAPHLYTVCDTLGLYVIPQAPIDSHMAGTSRRVDGNPSNNPAWMPFYLERVENLYHATKRHPSVVGFSYAIRSANGICLYESYIQLKKHQDGRPILYPTAEGEWNTDRIE
ncbi:MAG: hypothetical protein IKU77_01175 [Alistipes sp.]|nr:hypothetical protein [Alistipes sp.]